MPGTLTNTTTQTLQTTSSLIQQIGTQLNNSVSNIQYNLGNFVQNVSILPYIPSATIRFDAYGLKPNTRVYAYFDNVPVSNWCAPIDDVLLYNQNSISNSQLTSPYGTPLVTDPTGSIIGIFRIPPNKFQSQQITFELNDISDLSQGVSAIQTQADGVYYGSTLSVAMGQSLLNTRQTVLSSTEVKQQQTVQGLAVAQATTQSYVEDPPPARGGSGCGCKIICTKLYEMGLMDNTIFKADQEFGELLRVNDPEVYEGYVRWASIVVDWLDGNAPTLLPFSTKGRNQQFITDITYRIATPWAEHMAYLMGVREKDNLAGRVIMAIGKPISKLVSKLPKSEKKAGVVTEYTLAALFYVIYSISKLFGNKFGLPKLASV